MTNRNVSPSHKGDLEKVLLVVRARRMAKVEIIALCVAYGLSPQETQIVLMQSSKSTMAAPKHRPSWMDA